MHTIGPGEQVPFWPKWMLTKIDSLVAEENPKAPASLYNAPLHRIKQGVNRLRGTPDLKLEAHGDFHGNNLLIGGDKTYGVDFTELTRKLAVYDIVDLIKMDFRLDHDAGNIGPSGLSRDTEASFFSAYHHAINREVFEFCMQAHLLISWLTVSVEAYERSANKRAKYHRLERRLGAADLMG
ncbi:phosphotransferase [Pseudaestuariivita rosea]|uniref:phosphotransferase n=1 Tax=Pseudaestuariivita rosea TaxID=2763263 RepID=UPI0030140E62